MIRFGTNSGDIIQDKIGEDDFIFGFNGPDQIEDDIQMGHTPASDDFYFGGNGSDNIWSFYGSDVLKGQNGSDSLDVYFGGSKQVIVDGGNGFDSLTLWGFDESTVSECKKGHQIIIEQGRTTVIVHNDVEFVEFF